jgi:hypothetical protein
VRSPCLAFGVSHAVSLSLSSHLARLNVAALDTYKCECGISDIERKAKDLKRGVAIAAQRSKNM